MWGQGFPLHGLVNWGEAEAGGRRYKLKVLQALQSMISVVEVVLSWQRGRQQICQTKKNKNKLLSTMKYSNTVGKGVIDHAE